MSFVIVVAGGEPPPLNLIDRLPEAGVVIAADSGLDHARLLGLSPDVLVGDLDSVSPKGLQWAREHNVEIQQHSCDKDATDLELALTTAASYGDKVIVVGGGEGRLDHSLGNVLLLSSSRWQNLELQMLVPGGCITIIREERKLFGNVGDLVSLMAITGNALAVTTFGLVWGLKNATLKVGSSRGISNKFSHREALIKVGSGVVLALQPTT